MRPVELLSPLSWKLSFSRLLDFPAAKEVSALPVHKPSRYRLITVHRSIASIELHTPQCER